MSRPGLLLLSVALVGCGGCFTSRGGAESNRDSLRKGMHRDDVFWTLGKPKDAYPIPGQGDSADLATERWCYQYYYPTGKTLTILATAFIGLFFMDWNAYGFDVAFGRDGRILTISEVGPRRR
jgi:hypothetical protein